MIRNNISNEQITTKSDLCSHVLDMTQTLQCQTCQTHTTYMYFFKVYIHSLDGTEMGAGNTVKENSSIVSLIQMH